MFQCLKVAWWFQRKRLSFCPNSAIFIRWITAIGVTFILAVGSAYAKSRPHVVFMSPSTSEYWAHSTGFMRAVASDLNINLEVQIDGGRNRFSYMRMADEILSRADKPDYLVFICLENVTAPMLRMANDAGVKVFTFDTDVPAAAREKLGAPRQVLDNWIGHAGPDNVAAGETLARLLAQEARNRKLLEPGWPLPLIALSGTLDSPAAKDRSIGLQQAVYSDDISLLQLVYANWEENEAQTKTETLLKRYPQAAAIWSASDGMALGAISAAKKLGRQPGEDIFIGGVDWEPRALAAIRQGDLTVSLGRHFMGAGLLLILLNDYDQGYDFAEELHTPVLHYQLEVATRGNVDAIARVLNPDNWQKLNFANFSRALNPALQHHPEDGNQLMNAITAALKAE